MTARRRATEGIASTALPNTPFVALSELFGAALASPRSSADTMVGTLARARFASIDLAPLADLSPGGSDAVSAPTWIREPSHVRGRDLRASCVRSRALRCDRRRRVTNRDGLIAGHAIELGQTRAEAP